MWLISRWQLTREWRNSTRKAYSTEPPLLLIIYNKRLSAEFRRRRRRTFLHRWRRRWASCGCRWRYIGYRGCRGLSEERLSWFHNLRSRVGLGRREYWGGWDCWSGCSRSGEGGRWRSFLDLSRRWRSVLNMRWWRGLLFDRRMGGRVH